MPSLNPEHPREGAILPDARPPAGRGVAGFKPRPGAAVMVVALTIIAVSVGLATSAAAGWMSAEMTARLTSKSDTSIRVTAACACAFYGVVAGSQFLAVFRRNRSAANLITTLCLTAGVCFVLAFFAVVGEIIFERGSRQVAVVVPSLAFHATLAGCATAAGVVNRQWGTQLRHRPRPGLCLTCGYNLTGNLSGVCPECGAAI